MSAKIAGPRPTRPRMAVSADRLGRAPWRLETAEGERVARDRSGDGLGDLAEEGVDRVRRTFGPFARLVLAVLDRVGLEGEEQRHRQILEQTEDEERSDHDRQARRHEEDPGAHHDQTRRADQEGVLLADPGDGPGTIGTATKVDTEVASTIQISRLELPRM